MLRPWKLEIQIDEKSGKAVYLQIADAIITDIRSGRLQKGTALPGSRNLARMLEINRNTVVEALNVLLAEGWLVSKERQGTFVAENYPTTRKQRRGLPEAVSPGDDISFRIRFDDGSPDSKIAPVAELARAYRQIFNRKAKWQMMGYTGPFGDTEFRKAIAQMLNLQRGMQISEDRLCVTRGSQMAMYLTAQCLVEKGDLVIVEDPGYQPAWKALEHAGARLLTVGVDHEGLRVDEVVRHLDNHPGIKALYTTPHHQYPTTVTLSLTRRLELIRLSNRHGFTIIEDDYDNEFHFGYRPVLPLSSHAELKNYVYIGTMSKVVAPALRIGYLSASDDALLRSAGELRKIIDVQGDPIMEQAVLQLIQDGTIRRHLKRASHHYRQKRDTVASLLNLHLGGRVKFVIPDGGLAFWLVPNREVDWERVSSQLVQSGIRMMHPPLFGYHRPTRGIRLGYAALPSELMEESIVLLGRLLDA